MQMQEFMPLNIFRFFVNIGVWGVSQQNERAQVVEIRDIKANTYECLGSVVASFGKAFGEGNIEEIEKESFPVLQHTVGFVQETFEIKSERMKYNDV